MADRLRIVLVAAAVTSLPSCGGNSAAPTPTPTQASLTVTLSPNPVTAITCSPTPCQSPDGVLFQFRAQGSLALQETAGIGGNVHSVTMTVFNFPLVYGSNLIIQRSGTNHVAARGMLIFPLDVFYGPANNSTAIRQQVMSCVVQFTDDRGNQVTGTAQWSVN